MYAGDRWVNHPERPAVVMARSGERVTYADLERQSNGRHSAPPHLNTAAAFARAQPTHCRIVGCVSERSGVNNGKSQSRTICVWMVSDRSLPDASVTRVCHTCVRRPL